MTTTIRNAGRLTLAGACLGLATAVGPGAPSVAADSIDIGSYCVGNSAPADTTVVVKAKAVFDPLPITPGARGVITRATFNVPVVKGATFLTTLKVLRGTEMANEYTVVSQSAPLPVANGALSFDMRVPIVAGDLLGAWGPTGTLLCNTGDPENVVGIVDGNLEQGQTAVFTPRLGHGIPVVVRVEPDIDGDGYGDDTQDACDRSASVQTTACPVIGLVSTAVAQQRSVLVVVSADNPARVRVTGTTKVNGKKVRLEGGIRKVKPGSLGRFTVRYPKALQLALAALPPGRSIKVRLTARTTDALGQVTRDSIVVRVPRMGKASR